MLILVLFFGCKSRSEGDSVDYPNQFGEIPFHPKMDNPIFRLCDSTELVHSRLSLSYQGGRARIEEIAKDLFTQNNHKYEYNGYVLARFLVNCNGEVGRLRFEYLDENFVKQEYPKGLAELIRRSVLALDQWTITIPSNGGKDHSKYLNFKIRNGKIDAIIH